MLPLCYTLSMTVYFTDERISGSAFVERILRDRYGIFGARFARGAHGKPMLENAPLSFSLTHSGGRMFAAVAREELGLDAERRSRPLPQAYLRRLTPAERREDFFRLWTAKEAYVKYCGGTLAGMLPSLRFERGVLYEHDVPAPAHLAFLDADGYTIALCAAARHTIELYSL